MQTPVLSFTFLSNFDNCPRKAWHLYVAKDLPKTPTTPEQQHGQDVHKAFECRLRANKPFGTPYAHYEPFAAAAEQYSGKKLVEENLAITASGSPTDFFGKDVWVRGKVDWAVLREDAGVILDWKTGKPREDAFELELFALMLKCTYPGLKSLTGIYVWLKDNKLGKVHDLSNFARTYNDVKLRSKDIEALDPDKEWPAKPNPLCGWCPHKKCEHNKS